MIRRVVNYNVNRHTHSQTGIESVINASKQREGKFISNAQSKQFIDANQHHIFFSPQFNFMSNKSNSTYSQLIWWPNCWWWENMAVLFKTMGHCELCHRHTLIYISFSFSNNSIYFYFVNSFYAWIVHYCTSIKLDNHRWQPPRMKCIMWKTYRIK